MALISIKCGGPNVLECSMKIVFNTLKHRGIPITKYNSSVNQNEMLNGQNAAEG